MLAAITQQFQPKPDQRLRWTNRSVSDSREIQTGVAIVDKHGLVTLEGVRVTGGRNRIRVSR